MKLYGIENIHRGRKVFIPQHHTHTFISVSAISYFLSKSEELFSFSYEKAHPITEELNLFFGWWIVKHMINKRTYLEMKAIDRLWYGLNTEFLRNSQSILQNDCMLYIYTVYLVILYGRQNFLNFLLCSIFYDCTVDSTTAQ